MQLKDKKQRDKKGVGELQFANAFHHQNIIAA
ncbi:hypothetical protein VHE8714_01864 [Vibrio splendidus]|nr:hypothetical protein VHE8714_01864 [Vibrio splendidus]